MTAKINSPWLSCSTSQSGPLRSTQHGTLPSGAWYVAYQRMNSPASACRPTRNSAAAMIAPSRIHDRV